jgi:hypothetical protein
MQTLLDYVDLESAHLNGTNDLLRSVDIQIEHEPMMDEYTVICLRTNTNLFTTEYQDRVLDFVNDEIRLGPIEGRNIYRRGE